MPREFDVRVGDRTVHAYVEGPQDAALVVYWHHGSPQTGEAPVPLVSATDGIGVRWLSHDRAGYGRSDQRPGRDIAAVADDVRAVLDAAGVERATTLGHSGGGPHALACAALLPDRFTAVVAGSSPAPFGTGDFDWYAGMFAGGRAELQAAAAGRQALTEYLATAEFQTEMFSPADWAALQGEWAWLGANAGAADDAHYPGYVDDNLALVAPWGFDVATITAPVLILQGDADRVIPPSHAHWLAAQLRASDLRLVPGAGHVSVLTESPGAVRWLAERR